VHGPLHVVVKPAPQQAHRDRVIQNQRPVHNLVRGPANRNP